jgi:hypothetical protein
MVFWLIVLIIILMGFVVADIIFRVLPSARGATTSWWARTGAGVMRFWRAFFPDFTISHTGRDITETFRLLIVAIFAFGLCLLLWSTGAAVLRAGYLVTQPTQAPPLSKPADFPDGWGWGFLLLEVFRATGGITALCFASGLVGGLLGFLFGLPRPALATGSVTPPPSRRNWQTSTNLTEISDWLTKIIVGVGLVTATQLWGGLLDLTNAAALWLFNSRHGSPAVIPAAIIGGAIFGFMFIYLYTQLVVARLIAQADTELGELPDIRITQTIDAMLPFDEALVPRISRRVTGFESGAQPTEDQLAAALKFRTIKFGDLTKRADVRNWARARALLNDYRPAADAYSQLIGMPEDSTVPSGPDLLIEAARIMNATGDRANEAAAVAELALSELKTTPSLPPKVQEAIIGDAAALRLSRRVAGGYEAALKLLNDYLQGSNALPDATGRLHLLRALANGQKWHTLPAADQASRDKLKDAIKVDLSFALAHGQRPEYLRPFWDLTVARSPGRAIDDNEDDLAGIVDGTEIDELAKAAARQAHPPAAQTPPSSQGTESPPTSNVPTTPGGH